MERSSTWMRGMAVALAVAVGTGGALVVASPSGAKEQPRATATLVNSSNEVLGTVVFMGHGNHATRVRVELDLPASAPGTGDFHGLHVHATGLCQAPFTSAGGHWDVGGHLHGAHLGDLPSVFVGADGTASAEVAVDRFDVSDLAGRSVILHAGRDNFNNVPTGAAVDQYTANSAAAITATEATGNAGGRYGCGVIELVGSA